MELLLLLSIVFLTIVQLTMGVMFIAVFARFFNVDLTFNPFRRSEPEPEPDNTLPLENFKPDFKKPLKVNYEENNITPLP